MGFRRLLYALIVCAAAGGVLSGRALAATPPLPNCTPGSPSSPGSPPVSLPDTLVTAHFNIWYDSDPGLTYYITETQAGDIGAKAEQAYAAYAAMGFPAPLTSSPGRIDINVIDLHAWFRTGVVCTNGAFDLDSTNVATTSPDASNETEFAIGAGVFSEIEYTQFVPATTDLWLTGAAAEWASAKAFDYPNTDYPAAAIANIGPPDMALDCWDPNYTVGFNRCANEPALEFENIGLSRWTFDEYLAERYGTLFIDEVLADTNAAGSSYTGLANALAAHGTTFAAAFDAWTTMDLTGAYTASALQHRVPASYTQLPTGTTSGPVATNLRVAVDHLSTRYVEFDRGTSGTTGTCYNATLSLSVTIPAGTSSQPTFYWTGTGGSPVPLSISGSTGTATVPWDTCTYGPGTEGLLSLPNASSNPDVNSANFYVTASISVDPTKPVSLPVTLGLPPAPVTVNTPVVQVPSTDVAPLISVFGPELLTISATDRQLRLIVQSSSTGSLQAAIGSVSLGSAGLRGGNNDVRFTIPPSLVSSLRRSATSTSVLTLTPVSPTGTVTGQAVTREVSIAPAAPAAKPAAKPKAKPAKPKAKPKKVSAHK